MTAVAIFVSPHLDDAALSCGGGIARLTRTGTSVKVVSVFTADQPPGGPLSPLARRSLASWGAGDQPFALRRAENRTALQLLGAEAEDLGLLDAIYRRSGSGTPLYSGPLAAPAREDVERFLPQLTGALRRSSVAARAGVPVFCPAGPGGHVDHLLVRRAIEQIVGPEEIVYYEEYPYSTRPETSATADAVAESQPFVALPLAPDELDARIAAIGCYESQLRGLFPSEPERLREIASARLPVVGPMLVHPPDLNASRVRMAARVRRDAADLGGERYRWAKGGSPFPDAGA
jgi:LmbE family N-acetylglucosaminyl deacetylase